MRMCIITFTYVTIMDNKNTPKSGQVNYSSNNTMLVFILIKTATIDSQAVGHGVGVVLLVVGLVSISEV